VYGLYSINTQDTWNDAMPSLTLKRHRADTDGATASSLAAAHDAWFRAQVRQALAEADDSCTAWMPHDAVKQDMQRQREALQAQIWGARDALTERANWS